MSVDPTKSHLTAASRRPGRLAGRRDAVIRQRPRRRLTWPLRGLLAASLAVPVLVLALAAWQNLRLVEHLLEERAVIEAGELEQHDLNAFTIYPMVLGWVAERIQGNDWGQISHSPELHRFLANLETLPQIDAVWIVDASGLVRASGRFFPVPVNADMSGDDAFAAQREHDAGVFVGRKHADPLTHDPVFDISHRLKTPDGGFHGAIIVSADPHYFSDFYAKVSNEKDFAACLLRLDGGVLSAFPDEPTPPAFDPGSPFMRALATAQEGSAFRTASPRDGIERIYAFHRLSGFPVDVVFGLPAKDAVPAWRDNLINYLFFAVPASLALFAMTWLATRQIRRERIASWRWQTTARRLRREMNRRAQAEAELRQAQKIEALGQLTGGVAHDFNNLLAVLQGCLEMLTGRQADHRLQMRVELALETVNRGVSLTRQLLAFARHQPAAVKVLDLNAQLRGMAELLSRSVGDGVMIETDLARDLWSVDADPTRFELVVMNLAINARDAMPDGGTLRIRTANRETMQQAATEEVEPRGFVVLEISDSGTGMPAEVAERAFDPFFTTKEPGKGTGLGLSMAAEFARQSGGSARIDSAPGRGTTITLMLRRSRAPVQTPGPAEAPPLGADP